MGVFNKSDGGGVDVSIFPKNAFIRSGGLLVTIVDIEGVERRAGLLLGMSGLFGLFSSVEFEVVEVTVFGG